MIADEYLRNRLDEISKLEDGWISGGRKIKPKAIAFTRDFFDILINEHKYTWGHVCKRWDIAPFVNGSIIITYENGSIVSTINIAEAGISAFVENKEIDLFETLGAKFYDDPVMCELTTFVEKYFYH